MTFDQYIENPMGKANAVFAARDMYKVKYSEKWDALFMREAGSIKHKLYHDKIKGLYYAHIKIPSETVKNFYYDVVIQFYTEDNAQRIAATLNEYNVRFFSNDPAFIYTYLYVFRKYDMLVEDLKSKCPKASLTKAPTERNFFETPGYVKSIYFAYLFMKRAGLFGRSAYEFHGTKYHKTDLLREVMSGEDKMEERHDKEKKQKAAEKKAGKTPPKRTMNKSGNTKIVNTVKSVNRVTPKVSSSGKGTVHRVGRVVKKK